LADSSVVKKERSEYSLILPDDRIYDLLFVARVLEQWPRSLKPLDDLKATVKKRAEKGRSAETEIPAGLGCATPLGPAIWMICCAPFTPTTISRNEAFVRNVIPI